MSVLQLLKSKITGLNRSDLKPSFTHVPTTGDGNCGYNAMAIAIVANANNLKLKQAFKTAPQYWNALINYLYQTANLSRTKQDPYQAFQDYLKSVTDLRQREGQIAFALRKLFVNDLFSLIPVEVMQEYFLAAAIDYFAKQLQVINQEKFKGDDTFCQIPAIQNYLAQFYQNHKAQMPQPGVTMSVLQDTLLPPVKNGQIDTSLGGQLKQFWQNQGHRMYQEYSIQNGSLTNDFELTLVARNLQCNLSIAVRGNSVPFQNVIDCVGPNLHLENVPGHWSALVTPEQNKQISLTVSKSAPVITPAPVVTAPKPAPIDQPKQITAKTNEVLPNPKPQIDAKKELLLPPASIKPNVSSEMIQVINNKVDNFFDQLDELSQTGKITATQKADFFNNFFEKSAQTYVAMTNTSDENYRFNLFKNYHNACAQIQFNNAAVDKIAPINEVLSKITFVK